MDAAWLIAEPEAYDEYDLGPLKTGKEAEVFLIQHASRPTVAHVCSRTSGTGSAP